MITVFDFDDTSKSGKSLVYYSDSLPEMDLKVGEIVWLREFNDFLKIGEPISKYESAEYGGLDEISGAEITEIHHGFNAKYGYVKRVICRNL